METVTVKGLHRIEVRDDKGQTSVNVARRFQLPTSLRRQPRDLCKRSAMAMII
jgi:hypothetical protein